MKYLVALLALTVSLPALADTPPAIGQPAPAFSGTDIHGKTVSLSDFKGKIVVLEWTSDECPFVHKMYDSGAMQKLQSQATGEGVEWLSIVSSASGKPGAIDAAGEMALLAKVGAHPSDVILDAQGTIGHMYAAKTTPDMFVIGKDGTLLYEGAIDDHPSTDTADIPNSRNYVRAALDAVEHGQPIAEPVTTSYGCSIKY